MLLLLGIDIYIDADFLPGVVAVHAVRAIRCGSMIRATVGFRPTSVSRSLWSDKNQGKHGGHTPRAVTLSFPAQFHIFLSPQDPRQVSWPEAVPRDSPIEELM